MITPFLLLQCLVVLLCIFHEPESLGFKLNVPWKLKKISDNLQGGWMGGKWTKGCGKHGLFKYQVWWQLIRKNQSIFIALSLADGEFIWINFQSTQNLMSALLWPRSKTWSFKLPLRLFCPQISFSVISQRAFTPVKVQKDGNDLILTLLMLSECCLFSGTVLFLFQKL